MNNVKNAPVIKKETKNKIRIEFERTSLVERLKSKFLSASFFQGVIWYIFRLVLLVGIAYVILYPFFAKIAGSFMSEADFLDVTVRLIPKYPTLDTYKYIVMENKYVDAFINTLLLSLICAVSQTFICCLTGYGIAKFKFKGNKLIMGAVILSLVIPHGTIQLSMFMEFRYFNSLFIGTLLNKLGLIAKPFLQLTNSYWPLIVLSITGLAFKNGLYIFIMRQFFRGVPDELEESAYIDGSGTFRTFMKIIIPLSIPMMVTVFLFAFCWQWTDDFYTSVFFTNNKTVLMPDIIDIPKSLTSSTPAQTLFYSAINNTCGLMIIAPLVVIYLFFQRYLVQGIERSGIVG